MEAGQRRIALAEIREAVERLSLPHPVQVEWVSRRGLDPDELVVRSIGAVRTAVEQLGSEFSPVLRLRLASANVP